MATANDRYLDYLLDRLGADQYPSGELLNRVEASLDRGHLDDYLDVLFAKVEGAHTWPWHWAGQDSNLSPTDYESAALTAELPAQPGR